MAEAALKIEEVREPAFVRRFEIPDLSRHGGWLMKRFEVKFPDMREQAIAGYLRALIFDNEHHFMFQDHAVALFQFVYSPGIKPVKLVQERFVWIEDKEDKEQVKQAAEFYVEFLRWAKSLSAEAIIVEENTDVPHELIKEKLGRIFTRQQQFARV